MKSFTTLSNLYNSLTQNSSSTNTALGKQLINDQHRYLIQKYFDNEKTYSTTTVGAQSLTLTGSLAAGATSATLSAAWSYQSGHQLVTFSNSDQRNVFFTKNSTALTWEGGLTDTATTAISALGIQFYNIPANISKIKNDTIQVGQLQFVPAPIQTIAEWNSINFLPYTSDIPNYFFVYNGQVGFWPIPSTTGNLISFNYKARVADLTFSDYSTGTLASAGMVVGSTAVTGLTTSWSATGGYPTGVDLLYYNLMIRADPPYGDGIWYPIQSFTSDTALTLYSPVQNAPNITASTTYTIGQFPLLQEDFHDMLVFGALKIYFSSVKKDVEKYKEFSGEYDKRLGLLEDYAGTKSVNVDLGAQPAIVNPNLFLYASGSVASP